MSSWNEYKSTMIKESPLFEYARLGQSEQLFNELKSVEIKNTKGYSLLMLAAYNGHLELTKELIRAGADINSRDHSQNTILMGVSFKGYIEIAQELINAGADYRLTNNMGQTALDFAQMFGRAEVAQYLSSLSNHKHKPVSGFFKSWYGLITNVNKGV